MRSTKRDFRNRAKARHLLDLFESGGADSITLNMRGIQGRSGVSSGGWRKFLQRLAAQGIVQYALLNPIGLYRVTLLRRFALDSMAGPKAPAPGVIGMLEAIQRPGAVQHYRKEGPLDRALYCRKCGIVIKDKRFARSSRCTQWESQGGTGFHDWDMVSGTAARCGHEAELERGRKAVRWMEEHGFTI